MLSLVHALLIVSSTPSLVVTLDGGKSFEIALEAKGSPRTAARIQELVRAKFYDGMRFHRVEPWVVQWGAPASRKGVDDPGVGAGGSGKTMPFEQSATSFVRGVVGIASFGAKQGGDSQIFVLRKDATYLNGQYAVLGKVTKGMDVIDGVKRGDRIVSVRIRVGSRR
jgi:cyclophilin family peptidyl-prolyl cis-trans isomerase